MRLEDFTDRAMRCRQQGIRIAEFRRQDSVASRMPCGRAALGRQVHLQNRVSGRRRKHAGTSSSC